MKKERMKERAYKRERESEFERDRESVKGNTKW